MVRHAESQYIPGLERERGISGKGAQDALKVLEILQSEEIDVFVSSPYQRAIQTVEAVAAGAGKRIILVEDLRERKLADEEVQLSGEGFHTLKKQLYDDFDFAHPGGESSFEAQRRGVQSFLTLLDAHQGKKMVVGTHGDIMTLIMNYFDPAYGFEFWRSTSMPDVYKLVFEEREMTQVTRCWADGQMAQFTREYLEKPCR
ncbi:histidine phosphatase family protein [Paenibacillus sp. HJL G12]|uniref:Histidine phosphatase family protein n=1 Tax=Paenibacillus dendrobii TaxID=2691084 RepID=A0A7X3IGV7_9BACL|nr:histidine phosphatase family protein [Paenibacillus dendrobii]MWV43303.1 histidine phosphatase family protein [Paenibacillus dendrobii]